MALATAMYHSERDPLHRMSYKSKKMHIPRDLEERRLQKAFLRYHDPKGWPALRTELKRIGRSDLIGSGAKALIPAEDPVETNKRSARPGFKPKSTTAKKAGSYKAGGNSSGKSGGKQTTTKKAGPRKRR